MGVQHQGWMFLSIYMFKSLQEVWFCNFRLRKYVWILAGESKYIFTEKWQLQITDFRINGYNSERILQKE